MRNRTDIDHTHARAICLEIGERLRAHLGEEPELPANLKKRVDRLRQLEGPSPSTVPTNEDENGGRAAQGHGPRRSVAIRLAVATKKPIMKVTDCEGYCVQGVAWLSPSASPWPAFGQTPARASRSASPVVGSPDPDAAPRKLMELARAFEPVRDCRIHIEKINGPFLFQLKGTPAAYKARSISSSLEAGFCRTTAAGM